MKLEDLKEAQINEIMEWAKGLNEILTPDNLVPAKLKDFPIMMETSERLKRICKWKSTQVKDTAQRIEDVIMDSIEQAEYIFKLNGGGMPVLKKKFNSADKRARELRRRLDGNEEYKTLMEEYFKWNMMYSDWVAHNDRLRREMRILEVDYTHSGGDIWEREKEQQNQDRLRKHKNRL